MGRSGSVVTQSWALIWVFSRACLHSADKCQGIPFGESLFNADFIRCKKEIRISIRWQNPKMKEITTRWLQEKYQRLDESLPDMDDQFLIKKNRSGNWWIASELALALFSTNVISINLNSTQQLIDAILQFVFWWSNVDEVAEMSSRTGKARTRVIHNMLQYCWSHFHINGSRGNWISLRCVLTMSSSRQFHST